MKELNNVKLLPTNNPNYTMKESPEELIELFKKETTYIVNDKDTILGITNIKNKFYEEDGFICGSVLSNDEFNLKNYDWCNAEVMLDNDMNIKRIVRIIYKEK